MKEKMKEKIERLSLKKRDIFVQKLEGKEMVLEEFPELYNEFVTQFRDFFAKGGKLPGVGVSDGGKIPKTNLQVEMRTISERPGQRPERIINIWDTYRGTLLKLSDVYDPQKRGMLLTYGVRKRVSHLNDSVALLAGRERLRDLKRNSLT